MNLEYVLLRLFRHFLPEWTARFLLKRRWIIRPGLESSDPHRAVEQYLQTLSQYGKNIHGRRILVFGYGGRFAVGVELLQQGAGHVILCDHYVLLDKARNLELISNYSDYLYVDEESVQPFPEYISLVHGDIRDAAIQSQITGIDLVLSTSVFEHLDDVEGITRALAKVTRPHGSQLHFVDLRDHFFKYPFEMLAFSERVWKSMLNPTSNLNRFRIPDYRKIFERCFHRVDIQVLARQVDEFRKARPSIRPDFLSGDESLDSSTLIHVFCENPK